MATAHMLIALLAVLALAALAGAEIAVRLSGLADFPLYVADPECSYRMKPVQQGCFRRRVNWRYDRFGMRATRDFDRLDGVTLVIGDSVVDGGLHVDQDETLAERLAGLTGKQVYPVCCPGWSLTNELAALRGLPGWERAATLIFVLNTGDFDEIAESSGELRFPTRYPRLYTLWLFRRRLHDSPIVGRLPGRRSAPHYDPAVRPAILAEFAGIMRAYPGPVVIVRHPRRGEDPAREPLYGELVKASGEARTRVLDIRGCADWSDACYRDHIYPNAKGVRVLAQVIAQEAF